MFSCCLSANHQLPAQISTSMPHNSDTCDCYVLDTHIKHWKEKCAKREWRRVVSILGIMIRYVTMFKFHMSLHPPRPISLYLKRHVFCTPFKALQILSLWLVLGVCGNGVCCGMWGMLTLYHQDTPRPVSYEIAKAFHTVKGSVLLEMGLKSSVQLRSPIWVSY